MAVVGVAGERPDSPKAKLSTDGFGSRSYTREFQVLVDSLLDDASIVSRAPGLPRAYQPYNFGANRDQYALARNFDYHRLQPGSLYWVVRVDYRTFSKEELLNQYENPLLQIPEVKVGSEKFQIAVFGVINEDTGIEEPCRNSAGQIYDPPPMKDQARLTLTITRNESIATEQPSFSFRFVDKVNADTFFGCDPGMWKCQGIDVDRQLKQLQSGLLFPYLKVTYKFEGRETWDAKLLDAGAYYLDDNGQKLPFQMADGTPTSGPLDGEGGALAAGATAKFREFRIYEWQPFAELQLPQSFKELSPPPQQL